MKRTVRVLSLMTLIAVLLSVFCGCMKTAPDAKKETAKATEAEPAPSVWEYKYYVDDFGDPTDTPYIKGKFEGTFSNSATDNSKLKVNVLIDAEGLGDNLTIHFNLFEYGEYKAAFYYGETVKIRTKDSAGKVKVYETPEKSVLDGVYCDDGKVYMLEAAELVKAIADNEQLSINIEVYPDGAYSPNRTYKFKTTNEGLADLVEQLTGGIE